MRAVDLGNGGQSSCYDSPLATGCGARVRLSVELWHGDDLVAERSKVCGCRNVVATWETVRAAMLAKYRL